MPDGGALLAVSRSVTVVLRALGLGDLLTAFPALRGLRRARPGDLLVLLTTPGVAPLARAAGLVDEVVAVGELADLPLRGPVDLTVNLHGRGPASHALLRSIDARRRVGYDLPHGPAWPEDVHEVERWAALIDPLVVDGPPVDRDALDLELLGDPVVTEPQLTLVHPGASAPARRWPADRWAEVARREQRRGHDVVVTAGPDERALAATVVATAGLPPSADRSGTTVLQLAALVATAGRVVCGDTGVAHLATALGRPSVVLFGPTDPGRWGPPRDRSQHRVIWNGTTGDPQAGETDRGLVCITTEQVMSALADLDADLGVSDRSSQPAASRSSLPGAGPTAR